VSANKKLTAIELFAGIGGFRLGMEAANIDILWANDFNELSCRIYENHFGLDSIVCKNIEVLDIDAIPKHDLLTAGFPCQPFSPAGKKLGIRDRLRGTLFERIVQILDRKQPRYFILENVKRILTMENGSHFRTILKALTQLNYLIEWRIINPMSFGIPQNRDRVFIVGHRLETEDSFPDLETCLTLLTQKDLSQLAIASACLDTSLVPISAIATKNDNWGIAYRDRMYSQQLDPLPTIKPLLTLKDILQPETEVDAQFDFTAETLDRIANSQAVNRYYNGVEILYNQKGGARLGYTVFGVNGVVSTLTASTSRHYERYRVGDRFRRLTPIEYARLMGFPDNWCDLARVYDRYALFGNAVVPVCVTWICDRLEKQNIKMALPQYKQLTLAI